MFVSSGSDLVGGLTVPEATLVSSCRVKAKSAMVGLEIAAAGGVEGVFAVHHSD